MNDQTGYGVVNADLLIKYKQLEEKERDGILYIKRRLILQIILIEIINFVLFSIKYNILFQDLNSIFRYLTIASFTLVILFTFLSYYNIQLLVVDWLSKIFSLGVILNLDNYFISFVFIFNLSLFLFLSSIYLKVLYIISAVISIVSSIFLVVFLNKIDF